MPEQSALSIQNLQFRYGRANAGANDVGWTLRVGELVLGIGEQILLTGGSGHGKSTLLQLIAGLLDPDGGRVHVSGKDIHALHGHHRDLYRGRTVGMIFQTFNLLHGFTAAENVMVAMMFSDLPRSEHKSRALALLERLGIDEPHRDATHFSVGQQQRVAVARALACDPVLVLADEPTASLDPENSAGAMTLIEEVCREKNAALLCVSHDPNLRELFARRESLADLASNEATSP